MQIFYWNMNVDFLGDERGQSPLPEHPHTALHLISNIFLILSGYDNCTYSIFKFSRLPRLAGRVPLSWLVSKDLRPQHTRKVVTECLIAR